MRSGKVPEIFRLFGYHVYFCLNEGNPLEPVHVHVSKRIHQNATKIWFMQDGTCALAHNQDRIPSKDLGRIMKVLEVYRDDIVKEWKSRFGEARLQPRR